MKPLISFIPLDLNAVLFDPMTLLKLLTHFPFEGTATFGHKSFSLICSDFRLRSTFPHYSHPKTNRKKYVVIVGALVAQCLERFSGFSPSFSVKYRLCPHLKGDKSPSCHFSHVCLNDLNRRSKFIKQIFLCIYQSLLDLSCS